jgi:hypothetical protein
MVWFHLEVKEENLDDCLQDLCYLNNDYYTLLLWKEPLRSTRLHDCSKETAV